MQCLGYTVMTCITVSHGGAVTSAMLIFIIKTQMPYVNAFRKSCESSAATVEVVGRCPSDTDSYMKAAARKNCNVLQHDCTSFEYHCVLSNHKNTTIEVCAPSIRITGSVCAGYDLKLKRISRMEGIHCGDFNPSCPNNYNSTEAYKYSSCYESVSFSATSEDTTVNKRAVYSNSKEKQQQKTNDSADKDGNNSTGGGVIGGVLAIIAVILLILVVLYLKRQGKVCNCKKRKPSDEDIEMSRGLSSAPAISVREDPDDQDIPDDKSRGEDITQTDALQKKLSEIVGSKEIAYKEKHIRKLSFDTCNNFLKKLSEEFAAAGFFYKGNETRVMCFHCGQEMSDWTEEDTGDDIINKHYQLNKTCDYIHIIRQYRKM